MAIAECSKSRLVFVFWHRLNTLSLGSFCNVLASCPPVPPISMLDIFFEPLQQAISLERNIEIGGYGGSNEIGGTGEGWKNSSLDAA